MADYGKMYRRLFNAQTYAINSLEQALMVLKQAQQETEEIYMSTPDADIRLLGTGARDDDDQE